MRTLVPSARAFVFAGLLLGAGSAPAQMIPPGGGGTTYTPMATWSFNDTNAWSNDAGSPPISFTNVAGLYFGNGTSLLINSTNPAWMQYNTVETNGHENLSLIQGSVSFWFAPVWTSADQAGNGPGVPARLIEAGQYTNDASLGWWSLLTDEGGTNLYFMVQPGDGTTTTYLTAPISWASNYWHHVALTFCSTNTALYLDGTLATNAGGITAWPGKSVQAGGFYIGSDCTGVLQAQGAFDDLYTYGVPLDGQYIAGLYNSFYPDYYLTPQNWLFGNHFVSAPSTPSYTTTNFNVITGTGNLLYVSNLTTCISSSTAYTVWLTNITARAVANGTMNVTFAIAGGADGVPFDVFANSTLSAGVAWAWMGQGYHCNTYLLTNMPSTTCFLILGTPQSTSGQGLTDAYESLVAKVSPSGAQADGYGVPYAWYAANGLVPITNGVASLDLDLDALLNYQEYLYGTKPNVSEGFSIWTTNNGTTVIP